jgi:hypothetical protein
MTYVKHPDGLKPPDGARQLSTADLVRQGSEQLSRLVRYEIALAQAELRDKGRHAGVGAGLFGAAGLTALYGAAAVLAAVVLALALVMPAWAAALIVGVVLFATAGVMALIGRGQLKRVSPPYPQRSVQSARADVQLIKERASR